MKMNSAVVTLLMFAFTAAAFGQIQLMEYPGGSQGKKNEIPNFQNAIIAVDYDGTVAQKTQELFMRKTNARKFAQSPDTTKEDPCDVPYSVVCISAKVNDDGNYATTGGIGGGGNHGSYYSESSSAGEMYTVTTTVELIERDLGGDTIERLTLANSSEVVAVGSGDEWTSSAGRSSSGFLEFGGTTSLNSVVPGAVADDIGRLFKPGFKHCIPVFDAFNSSCKAWAVWYPGAAEAVAATRFTVTVATTVPVPATRETETVAKNQ